MAKTLIWSFTSKSGTTVGLDLQNFFSRCVAIPFIISYIDTSTCVSICVSTPCEPKAQTSNCSKTSDAIFFMALYDVTEGLRCLIWPSQVYNCLLTA